jgi:hypothetical protein
MITVKLKSLKEPQAEGLVLAEFLSSRLDPVSFSMGQIPISKGSGGYQLDTSNNWWLSWRGQEMVVHHRYLDKAKLAVIRGLLVEFGGYNVVDAPRIDPEAEVRVDALMSQHMAGWETYPLELDKDE